MDGHGRYYLASKGVNMKDRGEMSSDLRPILQAIKLIREVKEELAEMKRRDDESWTVWVDVDVPTLIKPKQRTKKRTKTKAR